VCVITHPRLVSVQGSCLDLGRADSLASRARRRVLSGMIGFGLAFWCRPPNGAWSTPFRFCLFDVCLWEFWSVRVHVYSAASGLGRVRSVVEKRRLTPCSRALSVRLPSRFLRAGRPHGACALATLSSMVLHVEKRRWSAVLLKQRIHLSSCKSGAKRARSFPVRPADVLLGSRRKCF